MTPPLNRDQQIELMKAAKERHHALMQGWLSHRAIKEVLSKPAPGQVDEPEYARNDKLACWFMAIQSIFTSIRFRMKWKRIACEYGWESKPYPKPDVAIAKTA